MIKYYFVFVTKSHYYKVNMFTRPKSLSFDKQWFFQQVQNAQEELTSGIKNITEKAKKEVKIVNKKARKALATEDGGKLRNEYVLAADLDTGYDFFKIFQDNWVVLHGESTENVKKSQIVDERIVVFTKECHKCNEYINEFHGNLAALSDTISLVEMAHKRIDDIGTLCKRIEELLVKYENCVEREGILKKKEELNVELSCLVETKHAEYSLQKALLETRQRIKAQKLEEENYAEILKENEQLQYLAKLDHEKQELARQESQEKQKAYGDAFLDQMNKYIQSGEVEKPIGGLLSSQEAGLSIEDDIQLDDGDLSSLKEFLGPEVMDVLKASQDKENKQDDVSNAKDEVKKNDVSNAGVELEQNLSKDDDTNISSVEQSLENIDELQTDNIANDNDLERNSKEDIVQKDSENLESNGQASDILESENEDEFEDCE